MFFCLPFLFFFYIFFFFFFFFYGLCPCSPVGDALGHPLSLTLASRSPDWAPQGWTLVYTGWSDGSIHLHRFQTGTDPADPDSKTFVRKVRVEVAWRVGEG